MYNIQTLADLSGFTRRTIRYYIQKQLLPPPKGDSSRGSFYTDEHLKVLKDIHKWSEQGIPLLQIKNILSGKALVTDTDCKTLVQTTRWERFQVAEFVEVHFREKALDASDLKKIETFILDLVQNKKGDGDA
ncbi:MerR family transcriptional regulator [Candidatus Uabimicrobium sp. HlEnr_7]|uniref:MerR family transcriptional regulator n=1 Tax=Candidatus Uabimicrobium helgolandensis TaxID=3095367 RepID=UPI003555F706